MNKDPYTVLGVSRGATPEELKKAYRAKSKLYHPDLHPDDPYAAAKMSELNEAYDLLTDPKTKDYYAYGGTSQGSYSNSRAGYSGYSQGYRQQQSGQNTYRTHYGSSTGYQNNRRTYGQGWSSSYWGFDFDDLFGFNSYQNATGHEEELRPENGDPVELVRAIRSIKENHSEDAVVILANMPEAYRNARWYYVSAVAYYSIRYYENAIEMIKMAMKLDPDNANYSYLYQKYSNETKYHYTSEPEFRHSYRSTSLFGWIRKAVLYFVAFEIIMFILRLFFFGIL